MATDMTLLEALAYFKQRMDDLIEDGDAPAVKAIESDGNTLKIYKTTDKTDTPLVVDLPEEFFLDQAKTTLADPFAWSDTAYPGSTDPELEGKPVMVFAVKGDDSVSYSFVSLEKVAAGAVNVSAEDGNVLEKKADGLYVGDLSNAKITTKEAIDSLFDQP